jgi:hypothetical protein
MSIGAILVGIALLVLSGAFVTRPLFKGQVNPAPVLQNPLAAQRDAIYALIRELDSDYAEGKFNDEDYAAQRERYVNQGVEILKQLDQGSPASLDDEIEARVLALRQGRAPASSTSEAARFCTNCGRQAAPNHSFCAGCGTELRR